MGDVAMNKMHKVGAVFYTPWALLHVVAGIRG